MKRVLCLMLYVGSLASRSPIPNPYLVEGVFEETFNKHWNHESVLGDKVV